MENMEEKSLVKRYGKIWKIESSKKSEKIWKYGRKVSWMWKDMENMEEKQVE